MFEFVTHWGNFDFSGLEIDFFICLNLIINGVTEPLEAGASSEGLKARRGEFLVISDKLVPSL